MPSAVIQEQLLCGLDAKQIAVSRLCLASQTILRADARDKGVTLHQIGREVLAPCDRRASTQIYQNLLNEKEDTVKTSASHSSLAQRSIQRLAGGQARPHLQIDRGRPRLFLGCEQLVDEAQ